jgi:hypothetical protein
MAVQSTQIIFASLAQRRNQPLGQRHCVSRRQFGQNEFSRRDLLIARVGHSCGLCALLFAGFGL